MNKMLLEDMLREMLNNRVWLVEEYQAMQKEKVGSYENRLLLLNSQIRLLEEILMSIDIGEDTGDIEFEDLREQWRAEYEQSRK